MAVKETLNYVEFSNLMFYKVGTLDRCPPFQKPAMGTCGTTLTPDFTSLKDEELGGSCGSSSCLSEDVTPPSRTTQNFCD